MSNLDKLLLRNKLPQNLHKLFFAWMLVVLTSFSTYATHYRAGEILYKVISGRTYEVTVVTYTDPKSNADESTKQIDIDWGDGTFSIAVLRTAAIGTDNPLIRRNEYTTRHTYATDDIFKVGILDRNRVKGILNINGGNTSDMAFYVASWIRVNSSIGNNQSPILSNPPIDRGCKGFLFVHDPAAYDPDGDSLTFSLVTPQIGPDEDAPNYSDPQASDSIAIDHKTGKVTWAKPMQDGYYNIAIEIREFRYPTDGGPPREVGRVRRDMQIYIEICDNSPPVITPMTNHCVRVGTALTKVIRATDPNPGQQVFINGISQPFYMSPNPAKLLYNRVPSIGYDTALFTWTPFCYNIRYDEYPIKFKATDDYTSNPMADYNGFYVKVIGPEPTNVKLVQTQNDAFTLSWKKDSCDLATKYYIYRRIDSSYWHPDSCERGVPAYTGFLRIGIKDAVSNPNDTSYADNDNGIGLSPLIRYCYRVVSLYPARNDKGGVIGGRSSESFASQEVCGEIIRSKPIITKVSVRNTDNALGAIQLNWIRPDTLDTLKYLPPYRLVFKHATNNQPFTQFAEAVYSQFSSIPDSSLIDSMLNTAQNQYTYQIDLHAILAGNDVTADKSPSATSVRTTVYATDNANILTWKMNVPWLNDSFVVSRKNALNQFDEIAKLGNVSTYTDTGLVNGQTYCYRIQSIGAYPQFPLRITNYSQEICGVPVDTVPPCPPNQVVIPPCSDFSHYENVLKWTPQGECDKDVVSYNIYYKLQPYDDFVKIASVSNTTFTYTDSREILKKSIAGCYMVTGVDSFDNESHFFEGVCIDNCPQFILPNVFTPNGDLLNDLFKPIEYRFIDKINFTVYNRWGDKVFNTSNLDINWDGTDQVSGKKLSDGVYFYTCEVYEQYLNGLRKRAIKGTIQIID